MTSMTGDINRRIRIAVLSLLKTQYPGSLDLKVLKFSLDNLGYPLLDEHISAHLSYLEEKGYLARTKRKGPGFEISFCTLTARGWDLIDGHITEKGIDDEL